MEKVPLRELYSFKSLLIGSGILLGYTAIINIVYLVLLGIIILIVFIPIIGVPIFTILWYMWVILLIPYSLSALYLPPIIIKKRIMKLNNNKKMYIANLLFPPLGGTSFYNVYLNKKYRKYFKSGKNGTKN